MTIHTRYGVDIKELHNLITGKITVRKCPSCDLDGLQYFDGETGMGVSSSPSGINPEWLTSETCDECYGLAYLLFYKSGESVF